MFILGQQLPLALAEKPLCSGPPSPGCWWPTCISRCRNTQTSAALLGQIAVPLMLFALGIRLMKGSWSHLGLALKCNLLYLLAGPPRGSPWLLPLEPDA